MVLMVSVGLDSFERCRFIRLWWMKVAAGWMSGLVVVAFVGADAGTDAGAGGAGGYDCGWIVSCYRDEAHK